eukprot:2880865-Lingulodinium_polyedra.AAC.1
MEVILAAEGSFIVSLQSSRLGPVEPEARFVIRAVWHGCAMPRVGSCPVTALAGRVRCSVRGALHRACGAMR